MSRPPHTRVADTPVADPYAGLPPGRRPRVAWRTATHVFELLHETRAQHAEQGYRAISWWALVELDLGARFVEWHTRRKVLRWLALHHPEGRWETIE